MNGRPERSSGGHIWLFKYFLIFQPYLKLSPYIVPERTPGAELGRRNWGVQGLSYFSAQFKTYTLHRS